MVKRKGLGQANTFRTNNNTSTGYGVAYADEVSGHRTVGSLADLYALHDWQLSASGNNTDNDAIGQLWYVVNADGNGNGCYYQLKDWSKRNEAAGWSIADYTTKAELGGVVENINTKLDKKEDTASVDQKLSLKADLEEFNNTVSGINANIATKANAQDVTNAIGELQDKIGDRVVVSGNVTNNPDEEDITAEGDTPQTQVLKLKDRAYDSLNASGKGYKILRKNWQPINGERKNVLTQAMINEPNTIYEIRYDFDLNGAKIEIKENCVLSFKGGKLLNGKILLADTLINPNDCEILFENIEIKGIINNEDKYARWFNYELNHDDWGMISVLFSNPGRVYLGKRTYNISKYKHTNETISICSDISIIGVDGTVFNAQYTRSNVYDPLFHIVKQKNIEIRNICIECTTDAMMLPPTDFGETKYNSSGIQIFSIDNFANNIIFENVDFNNGGYGIKFSKVTGTSDELEFSNIYINNCKFLCDVPLQGTGIDGMVVSNSVIKNRKTSSGNHPIYILPKCREDDKESLIFRGCHIYALSGFPLHIYSKTDTSKSDKTSRCLVENSVITAETSGLTAPSYSVELTLRNCNIKTLRPEGNFFVAGGMVKLYNCNLINASLTCNVEAYYCNFYNNNNILIKRYTGSVIHTPVLLYCCNIECSKTYVIYDVLDSQVPNIYGCYINSTFEDGLVSQRGNQEKDIEFVNCIINGAGRFIYYPKDSVLNNISFINCILRNTRDKLAFMVDSKNVKFNIINCVYNGDIINAPVNPINSGETSNRPPADRISLGYIFYDTTLKKSISWNGTEWTNMDGTSLGE